MGSPYDARADHAADESTPPDIETPPLEAYGADPEISGAASPSPQVQALGFTADELLAPIAPEVYLLPGLVPTESYSLIAGALSSYKSTLLHYFGLWRATGFDLLDLDPEGPGCDIGPALILVYEDSDRRFRARTQRIVQHAHAGIMAMHGKRSASDFLERVTKNFRRVVLTGQVGATLVCRGPSGLILPNQPLIDELLNAARAFTASNLLIGIDPLRLAITGSQNDDDGADIVVHVLNHLAMSLPDSGIVICSHTTKSGAKEQTEGYAAAAYSTSGSALYSQHARSNFLINRITAKDARELLNVDDIDDAQLQTQPIAKLTHGRLSHGGESPDRFFRNIGGALSPVPLRTVRTAAEQIDAGARVIVGAMQRLSGQGIKVTGTSLLADPEVQRLGNERRIRALIKMAEENGYIEFTGSTKDRSGAITAKGRLALATNGNESEEQL